MNTEIVVGLLVVTLVGLWLLLRARRQDRRFEDPGTGERGPASQPGEALSDEDAGPAAAPTDEASPDAALPDATAPGALLESADAVETGSTAPKRPSTRDSRREAEPSSGKDVKALKKGLEATRGGFISRLSGLFRGRKKIEPALLDEIEEVLITADIGVQTTNHILEEIREQLSRDELGDPDRIWDSLRDRIERVLCSASPGDSRTGIRLRPQGDGPTVVLVVGVNGVGKTTTIGKVASRFARQGHRVMMAAGDTFRAAAVPQLEVWGRRVECPVIKGTENSDPAAVVFDAVKAAQDAGVDLLLVDTAGRLHNKQPLMDELKKIGRTAEKALGGRGIDEVLLVLDSTSGQNANQQTRIFKEALDVSGLVLTKLDGTAKGGVIIGIVEEHGLPIRYIGIGEKVDDLRPFDAGSFVEALFERAD